MANPFVHVELSTTEPRQGKSLFYQSLFDWQLKDEDMGGGMSYTMISVGEGTGGGMMKQMVPGAPVPRGWPMCWSTTSKPRPPKAKSLGATIMRDVMEVMDAGWLSIIIDPEPALTWDCGETEGQVTAALAAHPV